MQIYLSICLLLFKGFYVCVNQYLYVNYKSDHVSSKDLDQTVNIDNIYNLFINFFSSKSFGYIDRNLSGFIKIYLHLCFKDELTSHKFAMT